MNDKMLCYLRAAAWLYVSLCSVSARINKTSGVKTTTFTDTTPKITINLKKAIFKTDPLYFSLGMDSNLIRNRWETFDFTSGRLARLGAALSPAYLRLSGTDADRMIFDRGHGSRETIQASGKSRTVSSMFPPSNFTMTAHDWDAINGFCARVGWRIVFGLNAQLRRGAAWDDTNALELLQYSILKGYASNLDFELGNEPDLYPTQKYLQPITGEQLGHDVNHLKTLLTETLGAYYHSSSIVGPDVASATSDTYVTDFLRAVDVTSVKAVTWHQYYGGAELKYLANYTDPVILDTYVYEAHSIHQVVSAVRPDLPVWQGETSSTYAPPGNGIDETYVAGFMLLDKLGLNAKLGISLFVRQTFYGFWFALVDQDLLPRPNYWVSLLYRNLVASTVLNTTVTMTGNDPMRMRMYAHCTSDRVQHMRGAVTLYGVNMFSREVTVDLDTHFTVDQYLLTSGASNNLTDTNIKLNGNILKLTDNDDLPALSPFRILKADKICMPPMSMAYYVLQDARAAPCM